MRFSVPHHKIIISQRRGIQVRLAVESVLNVPVVIWNQPVIVHYGRTFELGQYFSRIPA